MADTGVYLIILGLTVALPSTGASSVGRWYCYRLVPSSITSAISPCMFPCLFISPHEHPHIVVHSEEDGTPCKVTSGLHHETKVGRCSSGVCTVKMGPPVLKRKKRFICLLTLAKLIKAKKERRLLRSELEALKRQALLNHYRGVSNVIGGTASRDNLNILRGESSRGSSPSSADRNVVEIHLVLPGAGGTGAYNPVTGTSGSVNFGGSVAGRNLAGNYRSGVAGHSDFVNLGVDRTNDGHNDLANEGRGGAARAGIIPGSTDISVTTGTGSAGVRGVGPATSGTRVVTNIGVGHNGPGGSLGGNSIATVVATSAGNAGRLGGRIGGHSGTNLENRGGLVASSSASGGRNGAASVVGIAGVGVSNGISGPVGTGGVRHGARGAYAGNVVGIGGAVSTAATGDGTSYVCGMTPSAPGIVGARGPFPSSDGRVRGDIAGSGSGMEVERGSSPGNEFFAPTGGRSDSFDAGGFGDDGFGSVDDFVAEDGF